MLIMMEKVIFGCSGHVLSWGLLVICAALLLREQFARFLRQERPQADCRVVFLEICLGKHSPSAQTLFSVAVTLNGTLRFVSFHMIFGSAIQQGNCNEPRVVNGQLDTKMLREPVLLQSCCTVKMVCAFLQRHNCFLKEANFLK